MTEPVKIGIVTVSDRASQGVYEDLSGPAIRNFLDTQLEASWISVPVIIPDEREIISQTLISLCDEQACSLVVTTGGTGPAPRDITPEATMDILHKPLPGFGELMRSISQQKVPTAILSRQVAGIRNKTLVINLPGSPKAIHECLQAVFPAIPYCLTLIGAVELTLKIPPSN